VTFALDPCLSAVARLSIALVLGVAAVHKLRDPGAFRSALGGYRLLPDALVPAAAVLLAALEVAAAAALALPGSGPAPALLAALLLALYTAAIAVNLARGRRDIDCGCSGPARRQPLGPGLLLRNALLVAAALLGAAPVGARPLLWLDFLTVAAAVAVLGLLYAAADTARAQASLRAAAGERSW